MEIPSPKYVALWTTLPNGTREQSIKYCYRLWAICFVITGNQHLPYPNTIWHNYLADFILQNYSLLSLSDNRIDYFYKDLLNYEFNLHLNTTITNPDRYL